uniref:NADH-ubiquinone oxidoreductase chain 6 n=1 Tax=Anaspidinae sp. GENSP01 TaxID=1205605 RepID=A0A0S2MQ88_9CUCU|nr:NADH deshydrogenase subunit 6 [Anaspidinae sp. GENSP01]
MLLISISMILSSIFILVSHPPSMGLILLIQTMMICMMCGNMNINFWYSYILFLIMIGAMLILFIYMTSLASNEKIRPKKKNSYLVPMFLIIILLNFSPLMLKILMMKYYFYTTNMFNSMEKYFNLPLNLIFSFFIIYLFLTLIAVVKITNFKMGPIRQLN